MFDFSKFDHVIVAEVVFGMFNGDKRAESGEDAAEEVRRVKSELLGNGPEEVELEDFVELYSDSMLHEVYQDPGSKIVFGLRIEGVGSDNILDYWRDMGSDNIDELFDREEFKKLVRLCWVEWERVRRETFYSIARFNWFDVVQFNVVLSVNHGSFPSTLEEPGEEWIEFDPLGVFEWGAAEIKRDESNKVTGVNYVFREYGEGLRAACPIYKGGI